MKSKVSYSSGSGSHAHFMTLFDENNLVEKLTAMGHADVTVYGELYGGSIQNMGHVYGKQQRFVAFDVLVGKKREGGLWLSVENMTQFCPTLGLDVVPWREIPTDMAAVDAERDAPSVQAAKNGMGEGHPREGVVLRPLIELIKNNGDRRPRCKSKATVYATFFWNVATRSLADSLRGGRHRSNRHWPTRTGSRIWTLGAGRQTSTTQTVSTSGLPGRSA